MTLEIPPPGELRLPQRVLRVTELTRYLKRKVEGDSRLSSLSVGGEVTNLSRGPTGHYYFALKDEASQLKCVLWRQEAVQQSQELASVRPGCSAIVDGSLAVYEARGEYQLTVQRIHVEGEGAARLRFERLRRKLEAEGLFSPERKRPIPLHPRRLALITSPGSNAYHDVLKRLEAQWPRIEVIAAGVSVQGEHAPSEIELAIDVVNRLTSADVILLVRGGGSPEELEAFNDERVARAVFASRVPVITGVGHTQDSTIADLVADRCAATPTAAAAAAVPDGPAMRRGFLQLDSHMKASTIAVLRRSRQRLVDLDRGLVRASPGTRIVTRRQRLDELCDRLFRSMGADLGLRRRRLEALSRQIQALDPEAILSRGFALISEEETGRVISSVEAASPGLRLQARVRDGSFRATVDSP